MISPSALRVVEVNARAYKRIWMGSIATTFLSPVLFLAAMGLGFGKLVDQGAGIAGLEQYAYITVLAPGLLAATAMQTGASEASWPVMAGIKWRKTFHATLATPVGVPDLVNGFLIWVGIRLLMTSVAFVAVMALFDAVGTLDGLAAVPVATLTGLAFAAPITAYTSFIDHEARLATLFRFAIIPMFLFSGTFFPVAQLPDWIEPVAYATPLWHGVELSRAAALGLDTTLWAGINVAYLLAWTVVGWGAAIYGLKRRLQP